MQSSTHLDDRVLEAVALGTREKPQDLVTILHYVDSREKLILSRDELAGALERLIQGGNISEVSPLHFSPTAPRRGARTFSGVTAQQYRKACATYTKEFWAEYRKLVRQ
jgi:hypothetical protein